MKHEVLATVAAALGGIGALLYFLLLGIGTDRLPELLRMRR